MRRGRRALGAGLWISHWLSMEAIGKLLKEVGAAKTPRPGDIICTEINPDEVTGMTSGGANQSYKSSIFSLHSLLLI